MQTFAPGAALAPFVRHYRVVEATEETTRVLIPDGGITLGFRYSGSATLLVNGSALPMPDATLSGMRDTARRMRTSAGGGIILATFHEGGASAFFADPLHELFGETIALDDVARRVEVDRAASQVAEAKSEAARIAVMEGFLRARLQDLRERRDRRLDSTDSIVAAAVRAIRGAHGAIRIGALAAQLGLGQDRLEKRFRRAVGASPKQLASILRLWHAISAYRPGTSLARLSADAGYFDQSHFIREFRSAFGHPPQAFFRAHEYC
jgi:AraC-like DNA-binding protein